MSSSIIDFVNCHTEKELGKNKYINDKCLDVKELNGETIYQNNVLVATQNDINTLQQEINAITPDNPNGWINSDGITTTNNLIPFTDNTANGMKTDPNLSYEVVSSAPTLTVGNAKIVSANNNMVLETQDYILTKKDIYLQGTEDVQRYLTIGVNNVVNNVKTYVDKTTTDYICRNELLTKTQWKLASEYDFDNDVKIGTLGQSKKIYLNDIDVISQVSKNNLYNYYVSSVSGDDMTGNGNVNNPYKTITKAMTIIDTLSPDDNCVINLASGNYTENVIITKSGVSVIGSNSISTTITGNIVVNTTQNSSFYSVSSIANITIIGFIAFNNPTIYSNSLSISSIISATPNSKNNITITSTGGGLGADCTINNNSLIYANADTVPILLLNNSSLTGVGIQIQNNPSLSLTTKNYILVGDNARCNLFGCSLINASNSASVEALIQIANTSNVTSSSTINNSIFLFTNGVSTTTGAIINFTNSASSNTVNFYNNFCRCFLTQNAPNNYIVLKSGGGAVNFSQAQNIGRTPQHHIPATGAFTGWTKTTFPTVI